MSAVLSNLPLAATVVYGGWALGGIATQRLRQLMPPAPLVWGLMACIALGLALGVAMSLVMWAVGGYDDGGWSMQ